MLAPTVLSAVVESQAAARQRAVAARQRAVVEPQAAARQLAVAARQLAASWQKVWQRFVRIVGTHADA